MPIEDVFLDESGTGVSNKTTYKIVSESDTERIILREDDTSNTTMKLRIALNSDDNVERIDLLNWFDGEWSYSPYVTIALFEYAEIKNPSQSVLNWNHILPPNL